MMLPSLTDNILELETQYKALKKEYSSDHAMAMLILSVELQKADALQNISNSLNQMTKTFTSQNN
jgi:hypothetical protein